MEDTDFMLYGGIWFTGSAIAEFGFNSPLNATACFLGVFLLGIILFLWKKANKGQ